MNTRLSSMPRNRSQNALGRAAAFEGQEGIARLSRCLQSAIVRRDTPTPQGIFFAPESRGGEQPALKTYPCDQFRFWT